VISDALDLQFSATGGRKHLYHLFPKGPVGQICKLAEMPQPSGVSDGGFGYSL
jgi:tRNA 2-thiouridine synthesizing protein E